MKRFPVASLLVAAALLVAGAPVLEAKPQHAAPSGGQHVSRPGGGQRPSHPSQLPGHNGQYRPNHGQRPPAPHYGHGYGYRPGYPSYPRYRHYPYHYYPYGYYPSSGVYLSFTSTPAPVVRSIPVTRDLIASVQATLNRRGYDAGPVDGIIGGQTQGAIADYQADRGLRPTGVIDATLLRSLGLL
jgi:hypothetical protein